MVQPNMPMQHYATSANTPGSTQQLTAIARQGSGSGSHAPHIVKIKRPASRDHMASQAVQMNAGNSGRYQEGAGSNNASQPSGLPQMPQQVIQ